MGSPPASKAQMNFVSWVHGVATEGSVSWWETSQKNDKGYGLSPQKKHELQNQKYAISTQLGDSAKWNVDMQNGKGLLFYWEFDHEFTG